MQASKVMMMARKTWAVNPIKPPVAHSRRHEIMLAFRPSPEIPGFNLHYLAAARQWIKDKNTQQVDIGHIRKGSALTHEEIAEAEKRLNNLPESLKKEMEALWKDTSNEKKEGGLWVREEIKRSKFGGSINIDDYWATAIRLSKQFLVDGPTNLMKMMEEGGFLQPNKDHDVEEFSSYMEKRLGKRIYTTYQYNMELKSNTLEGVYVLFDVKTNEVLDHPNQIRPGKFRVGSQGCSTGGGSFGSGGGSSECCSTGGGGSYDSGGARTGGGSFESGGASGGGGDGDGCNASGGGC